MLFMQLGRWLVSDALIDGHKPYAHSTYMSGHHSVTENVQGIDPSLLQIWVGHRLKSRRTVCDIDIYDHGFVLPPTRGRESE